MLNGYTGKMEASMGSEFCESLPLSVLKSTVVGRGKITISIWGGTRDSLTEKEKYIE